MPLQNLTELKQKLKKPAPSLKEFPLFVALVAASGGWYRYKSKMGTGAMWVCSRFKLAISVAVSSPFEGTNPYDLVVDKSHHIQNLKIFHQRNIYTIQTYPNFPFKSPHLSPSLPISPHLSPSLPISPHLSPSLPISPHLSPSLPISPHLSPSPASDSCSAPAPWFPPTWDLPNQRCPSAALHDSPENQAARRWGWEYGKTPKQQKKKERWKNANQTEVQEGWTPNGNHPKIRVSPGKWAGKCHILAAIPWD